MEFNEIQEKIKMYEMEYQKLLGVKERLIKQLEMEGYSKEEIETIDFEKVSIEMEESILNVKTEIEKMEEQLVRNK
tara:strand:- start:26 stop:253 length:228 start_codon:yes stop_codon:yes gene_type:complete